MTAHAAMIAAALGILDRAVADARIQGDRFGYRRLSSGADSRHRTELVELLTDYGPPAVEPLPETTGSIVQHEGTRYVRVEDVLLSYMPTDAEPARLWRPLDSAARADRRTSSQLAGAEILLDASTLTPSKETPA